MTKEELDILKQLSIIGKRINKLPKVYDDPEEELRSEIYFHINALQRVIFARDGQRSYLKVAAGHLIKKLESGLPPQWLRKIQRDAKIVKQKQGTPAKKKTLSKKQTLTQRTKWAKK